MPIAHAAHYTRCSFHTLPIAHSHANARTHSRAHTYTLSRAHTHVGLTWIVDLGRILNREVINMGFSGACVMQPEVAKYLVELKPSLFIMDCLPNMNAEVVAERAPSGACCSSSNSTRFYFCF